jgi:hypothetical protein
MLDKTRSNTKKGEQVLAFELYEYLHDQGVQFHIEPKPVSGRIDLISSQIGKDRLVADVKVFDPKSGHDCGYVIKGFRQVYDYARDFNEPFGYLVIFKLCENDLSIASTNQESTVPFFIHNTKSIFFLVIDSGWVIGSPTYGPRTNSAGCGAYSCPNCATTGLNANAPAASGRFIRLQSFLVPPADQFPRLRFWHWYSFTVGNCFGGNGQADYGVVQIEGTNGVWQDVSQRYYYSIGGWTCPSVDLSGYSGQTVHLGFYFASVNNCGYTAPGWYVDNIYLETGTPLLNCLESWNNGLGDWYADRRTWQVGVATKSGGAPTNSLGFQAYSGSNCAVTVLNSNYAANGYSSLVSPPFIVPPSISPQLSFWHWYSFTVGNCFGGNGEADYGQVMIAVGTNTWRPLPTIIGTYPQHTGTSARWSQARYDLSPYCGQTICLAFYFAYVNNCGFTAPGWYVDDVQVTPCPYSAFPPYLRINGSTTNAITSWTWLPSYSRFRLLSNTNLASTNWNLVSSVPAVISGVNTLTNPTFGTNWFYRLLEH